MRPRRLTLVEIRPVSRDLGSIQIDRNRSCQIGPVRCDVSIPLAVPELAIADATRKHRYLGMNCGQQLRARTLDCQGAPYQHRTQGESKS
jgi:hypothetical protein